MNTEWVSEWEHISSSISHFNHNTRTHAYTEFTPRRIHIQFIWSYFMFSLHFTIYNMYNIFFFSFFFFLSHKLKALLVQWHLAVGASCSMCIRYTHTHTHTIKWYKRLVDIQHSFCWMCANNATEIYLQTAARSSLRPLSVRANETCGVKNIFIRFHVCVKCVVPCVSVSVCVCAQHTMRSDDDIVCLYATCTNTCKTWYLCNVHSTY